MPSCVKSQLCFCFVVHVKNLLIMPSWPALR